MPVIIFPAQGDIKCGHKKNRQCFCNDGFVARTRFELVIPP